MRELRAEAAGLPAICVSRPFRSRRVALFCRTQWTDRPSIRETSVYIKRTNNMRHVGLVAAAVATLLVGPVRGLAQSGAPPAQPGYGERELAAALGGEISGLWRLEQVTIEATANTGTIVEPVIRTRWNVKLALNQDTFIKDGDDGPIIFVRAVAKAGLEKFLYGTSTAKLFAGSWQTTLEIQNREVLGNVGVPAAQMAGRIIVRGSDEEKAYWDQRERETAAAHAARLAQMARERDVADKQHQARAAEEQRKHEERVAAAKRQREIEAEELKRKEQEDASTARMKQQRLTIEEEGRAAQIAAREEARRKEVAAREAAIKELQNALKSPTRSLRLAAFETALNGSDPGFRLLALEAGLASDDQVLSSLSLRSWFKRMEKTPIPVQVILGKEQETGIAARDLNPARLLIVSMDVATGGFRGQMRTGGRVGDASGTVSKNEVSAASQDCTLTLRIAGSRNLEGTIGCTNYSGGSDERHVAAARVVLD